MRSGSFSTAEPPTTHKHRLPPRRIWGRAAVAAVSALALAFAAISAPQQAQAAGGDQSRATGTFLSGSLLDTLSPLQLARIGDASAANNGNPTTITNRDDLDATVLQALGIDIGGGIQVPLALLNVGALSSYATASDGATSLGASGLVNDQGAIGVGALPAGSPGPLTLNLSQLVGSTLAAELADLSLELGAISARASSTAGATPQGSYEIIGGRLLITSNTLAGTAAAITSLVSTLQASVTALNGPGGTLTAALRSSVDSLPVIGGAVTVSDATVSVTTNLQAAIAPLLGVLGAGGPVTIDLSTGQIAVDLQQLNGGLNGLAPNTDILTPAGLNTIASDVTDLITGLSTSVQSALTSTLAAATVAVDVQLASTVPIVGTVPLARIQLTGTVAQVLAGAGGNLTITAAGIPISAITPALVYAALQTPLNAVVSPTTGALGVLATGLQNGVVTPTTTVIRPAVTALSGVIALAANVQSPSPAAAAQRFSQTALRLQLLPHAAAPGSPPVANLLELNVAQASVGPNALATASDIASLSPITGPTAGGTPVTITGSGFLGATGVTFGGTAGTNFAVVSDTTVTVLSPPHGAGGVPVVVEDPAGNSASATFTFVPPAATTSLTPPTGPTTGNTVVTIRGTNLTGTTGATFGGSSGTNFTVINDTTVTVNSPAHAVGPVDVVVTSPDGTTVPQRFSYVSPPTIASLAPTSGPTLGGTAVNIAGTGFTGTTAVTFGGSPATDLIVNSPTSLSVTTPPHSAGTVSVIVTTPTGSSQPGDFTFIDTPAISALTPTSGPSVGGTTVTIVGTGFIDATGVEFGNTAGSAFVVNSPTRITVTSPAHAVGPVGVVILHPTRNSDPGQFTFVAPGVPNITSIAPDNGPTAGGTTVVITGTDFTGTTAVDFGTIPATSFTVNSATQITAVSPPAAAGIVNVVVTTPLGISVGVPFTYVPPTAPAISGLTPTSGPVTGNTAVIITGANFGAATGVTFRGAPGTAFQVTSPTTISVATPPNTVGAADVIVQSPAGASIPETFTYLAVPLPAISAMTPTSGPTAGGTSVTITGSGFSGDSTVYFGGAPAVSATVTSPTSIIAVSPPHAVGTTDVTVQNVNGVSNASPFTFIASPLITALAPQRGPISGGTSVVITGTSFSSVTAVTFDGVPATSFAINSPTQITAVSPPHSVGTVPVVASGPDGATLPADFTFVALPTIESLNPSSGPASGGTTVIIIGTGFTDGSGVTFGGVPAATVIVNSATSITVTTPAGAPSAVDVVVTGPDGNSGPAIFTYLALPGNPPETVPPSGGALAFTGGDVGPWGFGGSALLAVGLLLLLFAGARRWTGLTVSGPRHRTPSQG